MACDVDPAHFPCFNCLEPGTLAPQSLYAVDRLRVERAKAGALRVVLVQEKNFPLVTPKETETPATPEQPFALARNIPPDEFEPLLHAASLEAQRLYPLHLLYKPLLQSAKLAAMVRGGETETALALDRRGRPVCLLCWERTGASNAIFFGPYVFGLVQREAVGLVATLVVEEFLNRVARSDIVGVFSGLATPELPAAYFEQLGEVPYRLEQDLVVRIVSWYRHLREDFGATVWTQHGLEPFLRQRYDELAFVREFRAVNTARNETVQAGSSLFALDVRRELSEAVIRPLENGGDYSENLDRHLVALAAGGIRNVFFHLDLGHSWQAALAPLLFGRGFAPVLLLPCAGYSDILVMQRTTHRP